MSGIDELCHAINVNDIGRVRELIATHSGLADTDEGTPPPIHWAIYQNNPQMVELLLDHGADIERTDQDRNATPLDYAIVYGRREIIPTLVARGANVEGRLNVALKGASGGFEEFDELPSRLEYEGIVDLLRGLGAST